MLRYFISTFFVFSALITSAQDKPIDLQAKDTVVYKQAYGLRFGIDLSRPLISVFEEEFTGFEIVGDYRLTQKYYIAAELGNEKRDRQEDLFNFTTSGSYIKVGFDYNTYGNWYGEHNLIYIGGRYAFSSYSQTVNNYKIFNSSRYWNPGDFVEGSSVAQKFDGLNASWLEFVLGIKTELFANIFLGGSVRLGILISNPQDKPFPNHFVPGFNKVTDNSRFGIGYNFSLTYFVPLYKKAKKSKKVKTKEVLEEKQ